MRNYDTHNGTQYISALAVLLGPGLLWNGTNWCLEMHPAAVLKHSEPFVLILRDVDWTFISSANEFLSSTLQKTCRAELFNRRLFRKIMCLKICLDLSVSIHTTKLWFFHTFGFKQPWTKKKKEEYLLLCQNLAGNLAKNWRLIVAQTSSKLRFVCLHIKTKLPVVAVCQ